MSYTSTSVHLNTTPDEVVELRVTDNRSYGDYYAVTQKFGDEAEVTLFLTPGQFEQLQTAFANTTE